MPWYRRLPGFRSGRRWKQAVAIAAYSGLTLVLLLIALGLAYGAAHPPSRDRPEKVTVVRDFIAALNTRHPSTALRLTTPDFVLFDTAGASVTGSQAIALLTARGTPIRIISLTPHTGVVTGVLEFGSGSPTTAVTFTGSESLERIARLQLAAP